MHAAARPIATAIALASLTVPDGALGATAAPPIVLQVVLRAPMADALPSRMQEAIASIRVALGATPKTARAAGLSLYPELSAEGDVTGYSAVDRLKLRTADQRTALARARAASEAVGAEVSVVPAGSALPSGSEAWEAQWTEFG